MRSLIRLVPVLVAMMVLVMGCSPAAAPAPAPATSVPAPKTEATSAPKATEAAKAPSKDAEAMAKYEALVQDAKKESKIRIVGSQVLLRDPLKDTFGKKFGIEVEFSNETPAAMLSRMKTERQAGQYNTDMVLTGATSLILDMIPGGMLDPLDEVLVLPEVTDTSKWLDGKLPWNDPEHRTLRFNKYAESYIMVNTSVVGKDEIKVYKDLLNPKWKGKIAGDDPTVPGAGETGAVFLLVSFGEDFVRQLYLGQEVVFSNDRRQLGDWVSRGKYPVLLWSDQASLADIQKEGFPVDVVTTSDAAAVSGGWGLGALINKAPHPNAAKLFMNWIASKEGQDMLVKVSGRPVTRLDADLAGVPERLKLKPGVKYVDSYDYQFVINERSKAVNKLHEMIKR